MSEHLPNGWQLKTLGEFVDFKNGVNADKSAYGTGMKFVNVMDVFQGEFLTSNKIRGSVQISEKQKQEFSVIKGDILFNRTSETREDIACTTVYMDDTPATFGGFVIRGRQFPNLLTPEFSGYCFQSSFMRKELIRRGQGAIRSNIGQKDLNKVTIFIPPMHQQNKIAETLITWDKAIEKTEALITAKQKQFDWLARNLLSLNDSQCKTRYTKFGDVIDERCSKSTVNNAYPCLTSSRKGMFLQEDYFNKKVASKNNTGYKIIKRGDFTFRSMSDDGTFVFNRQDIVGCGLVSPAYSVFYPVNIDSDFLMYFLNSSNFKRMLNKKIQGGTRVSLKLNAIKDAQVILPSRSKQTSIAHKLNYAKHEIETLKVLANKYNEQKCGLMQKLLSGEWQMKGAA